MSNLGVRFSKQSFLTCASILFAITAVFLIQVGTAGAQADNFLVGNGQDGDITMNAAGTYVPNAVAPVSGAVPAGSSGLTIGSITAGSNTGNVTFANQRLVMVYQSNGATPAPTSGNQAAYVLSNSTAAHWEFARISSIAGSTFTFTAPLIKSYAAGSTQVIAVPEWNSLTVSNAGVSIQPRLWDGSVGGVVVALVKNTAAFSAAGTITASGSGFRGGPSYVNNTGETHDCGTTNDAASASDPLGLKGEGFYAAAFSPTTSPTSGAQKGRGNQLNAGGGGNCFNGAGGGGGNVGQGGSGGNSLNQSPGSNQAVGGLGGAALTYNAYAQAPMGGGGGQGDRDDANPATGGRGGGVVYFRANALTGSGTFTASGSVGGSGNSSGAPYDGAGGGGAGGTVVLRFTGAAACGGATASGGNGGANGSSGSFDWTPGGGGGGGAVYVQKTSGTCNATAAAGNRGSGGSNAGASNGGAGGTTTNTNALTKPTVTLTAPVNGTTYATTTPAMSGTATANSTVYVYIDGILAGTTTATAGGAWSYSTAALSQGGHTIKVFSDVAGSQSDEVSAGFTVDTVAPPAPTITTPATSPYYSSTATPTIGGTAEANSTVKVYDGATLVATTTANGSGNWSVATSSLATGSHTITATATDAANNVSVASGSKTIIVDTTAPSVSLTAPANGSTTNDNTPAIAFSVTDTNPGASSYCIVDGGAPFVCTSGSSLATLADGSHTLRVTNTDLAGNAGTSATNTFTVDTTAPAAPAITTPATSPYYTNNVTPTVGGTAEAGSTVRVYDGATLVGTIVADGSGNWSGPVSALSVGSHTITATATDAAGNLSSASGSKTIMIDTSAPAAPVITTPATSPYSTNDTTPTIAGTAEANSTVNVYDGVTLVGTTTADGSGNWTLDTSALSAGSHTINATATDAAGNVSAGATPKTVVIDTTAPAAPVITTPATSPYYTVLPTPTVAGTAEPNSTVKVYDGASLVGTTGADGSGNWGLSTSSLSQGSHTITATATDAAGNISTASTSKTIIVDSVAPAAPVITTPATSPYYAATTTPTIAGTAEPNSTVKVYDNLTLVGTTTADGSGNWSLSTSALSQGNHPISATATDAAGNVSSPATSKIVVVDTVAPSVSITAPADGSTLATTQPSITFTVVDDNTSAASECNIDGAGWVSCSSGYTPPALNQGSHSVVVRHTDIAGNVGTSSTVNFTVDTVAPSAPNITSGPSGPVATVAATFTFTGEPGGSYECYVDSPVDWQPCTSPAAYGPMSQGPHTFHVRQTDGAGNVGGEASQSWTVDTVGPPAPSVSGPSGTVGTSDATITFSDTEAPVTFVCGLDGATPTACTSPVDLTGLADGPHSYSVYALDPLGNVSPGTTINWTIDSSLFSVSITSGPTGTVATSSNSFDFVATITSGTTYECRVDAGSYAACTSPFSTGSLSDGSHTFYVRAKLGSQTSAADSRTYTVDTTAPSITISAPTNGQTVAPDGNVSFTASDSTGPVDTTCAIDSDTPVSCSDPFPFSGLSTGSHSVTVSATDGVGNATSLVRNFVVDATPPNTTITSTPDAVTNQTGASFAFDSSEGSSTFECKIDADSYVVCASPWNYTGLTEGSHTFSVRAIDQYGNVDPSPDTFTWTVDLTAPAAPAITTPAIDVVTADNTPSVGGTAEPNSTVNVYEGLTLIGTATADGSGDWSLSPDPTLSQGAHTLTAYATDAAGNVSPGSSPRVITIDTITPSVAIGSPAPGSLVGTDTPAIAFVATDDHLDSVECSVDGGTWVPCGTPWTTPSLSDGPHTASVRATDAAGNTATDTTNFTVDNTAPADPTVDTPATDTTTSDVRPTFAGDAEADSTVRLYVNGSLTTTTTADGSGRWSYTPTSDLPDGVYAVYVTAEDAAGNVSNDSNTRTVTVDTTAPADPTIDSPAADAVTSDATPTISGSAEPNSDVKIYNGASQIGSTTADGSGVWTWTPSSDLADDVYAFHVTATDAAGNTSNDSNVRTITVDTNAPAAPEITTPGSDLVTSTTTQPIGGTAEPDSTVNVYEGATLIGTATADGSGNWSLSPDPTFAEGVHALTAYATDAANNTSPASSPRVITIDTNAPAAPAITAPTDGQITGDSTPSIFGTSEPDATVKVYEGATLLCTATADAVGNWSCTSTALAEGDHTLHATATDAAGNTSSDSGDVTITVDLTDPSVQITSPSNASTTNDRTPDVSFTATDTNLTAIECSVDSGSFVACTSPWTTPSLSDGSHTISVRGTDAAGNVATSSITITIDATAPTSTIGTKPPALDTDTTPTFTFTSESGATFECRIDSDAFAPCTSPFTGGPLSDGAHTFEVRATDTNGNTESPAKSYSWTIDSTPPAAPVVSAPANGSTTTDNTPTLSGTAEPGSTVQIFVDGNSVGTVTATGGGNWSLTSAHLSDGPHTVSARATDTAGNVSAFATTNTFVVDTTAPDGTITEQPNAASGNPSFIIVPNEGETSIACSLDGGASSPCSSPFIPTGTLAPGTHTLTVTFTDQWGNARQVTYTFTIAGIPDPTACEAKGIAIANLLPKGTKVTVSGYARLTYVGQKVTIKYKGTGKAVATATVGADGKYSTTFKAPAKKLWTNNKTVYQATVGSESTAWTKLTRRVQASTATYAGGKLIVKGTLTKPFLKAGIPVEVKARTGCSDPWKVIGNIKAKKNGTFTFTTNYTPDTGVIFVQFKATLASDKGNKFPTKSFVMPVIVK